MIEPEVVAEVERLLKDGQLSRRRIAVATGVSRATVANIATGARGEKRRVQYLRVLRTSGPYVHCRTCGGEARMPCLLCQVRAGMRKEKE